jgi:hypothetical protein
MFLFLSACVGFQSPPSAAPEPGAIAAFDQFSPGDCNEEVASTLAGAGIPVARLSTLPTVFIVTAELKEQLGSVVVKLDRYCRPMQVYAREDAQLPS